MAVYTRLTHDDIQASLGEYTLPPLLAFKEIAEGVENSNYLLSLGEDQAEATRYILTIYESRVNEDDLPFFLGLMEHLAAKGFDCPLPIKTKAGQMVTQIAGKPAAMVSFLSGKSVTRIENEHLKGLGTAMAQMHLAARDFELKRPNDLSPFALEPLFTRCGKRLEEITPGLFDELQTEITTLSQANTENLEVGIIHADLFPDNIFFLNDKVSGIIDYYFACSDVLIYDLAICLNAWCFEPNREFNITKAKFLLHSYHKVRQITESELEMLPLLARGSALRFLLTRAYDWLNQKPDALVKVKDPMEYVKKWRFHRGVKHHKEYGL